MAGKKQTQVAVSCAQNKCLCELFNP